MPLHEETSGKGLKGPIVEYLILIGLTALGLFGLEEIHRGYLVLLVFALGLAFALVKRSQSGTEWNTADDFETPKDYDGGSFDKSAATNSHPSGQSPIVMDGGSLKQGLFG